MQFSTERGQEAKEREGKKRQQEVHSEGVGMQWNGTSLRAELRSEIDHQWHGMAVVDGRPKYQREVGGDPWNSALQRNVLRRVVGSEYFLLVVFFSHCWLLIIIGSIGSI